MKFNKALVPVFLATFGFSDITFAQGFISMAVGQSTPYDDSFKSDAGIRITGGTKINENFSVEMGYTKLGHFEAYNSSLGQLSSLYVASTVTSADVDISGFELSVVGSTPLTNKFIGYGRVGIYAWSAEGTVVFISGNSMSNRDNGEDLLFGVGVGYKINSNLSASTEFARYKAYSDTVDLVSLGVKYQF